MQPLLCSGACACACTSNMKSGRETRGHQPLHTGAGACATRPGDGGVTLCLQRGRYPDRCEGQGEDERTALHVASHAVKVMRVCSSPHASDGARQHYWVNKLETLTAEGRARVGRWQAGLQQGVEVDERALLVRLGHHPRLALRC